MGGSQSETRSQGGATVLGAETDSTRMRAPALSATWGHREEKASAAGEGLSPGPEAAGTSIVGSPASRTGRGNRLLCMVAQSAELVPASGWDTAGPTADPLDVAPLKVQAQQTSLVPLGAASLPALPGPAWSYRQGQAPGWNLGLATGCAIPRPFRSAALTPWTPLPLIAHLAYFLLRCSLLAHFLDALFVCQTGPPQHQRWDPPQAPPPLMSYVIPSLPGTLIFPTQ